MKTILVWAILVFCTIVPIVAIFVYDAHLNDDVTAEILARAPEKGNFLPRNITVKAGEKVILRIRNVDTVTHGFAIPALGVEGRDIKAGRQSMVEFTAEEPGDYDFYCTAWCGDNHLQMRGVITVVR